MDIDLFHHVTDGPTWELPKFMVDLLGRDAHLVLPWPLTKYMVLQIVAAVMVFVIFRGLTKRIAGGKPAIGMWWNFWEMLALYIRDEVVRPSIGIPHHHDDHHDDHSHAHAATVAVDATGHSVPVHSVAADHGHSHSSVTAIEVGHPADRYLPFVWSVFFYILICNLLGAIPLLGSPTANINVTGVLAFCTFVYVIICGSEQTGFGGFLKGLVPSMDLPGPMIALWPMIWVIEAFGLLIKHGVLAIRLFANIMAGHTVLGVFLAFIAVFDGMLWTLVTPASIMAQVAIGLLELFVAFLQAYVFAMLASLFISAAVNPH